MTLIENILSLLKEQDYSFEELKAKTGASFFDLQSQIKVLLKDGRIHKHGFPTKYSLFEKKVSFRKEYLFKPLLAYREVFLVCYLALFLVFIYSVFFKNPFVFPGLEERAFLVSLPFLFISIMLYFPWKKLSEILPKSIIPKETLVFLDKFKELRDNEDLKKFCKEFLEKIVYPYYPHFLIILSVTSLINISFLSFLNSFFTPIAIPLILISVVLIILKGKSFFNEKEFTKYVFLFLLILVTLSSLKFEQITFITKPLLETQLQLTIITIILGAITFYQNKQVIEEIEEEQTIEEKEEEKRALEFDKKYPKLVGIPLIGKITKWMYKEGWDYTLALVGILIVFLIIQIYKIYTTGIGTDEGNFLYTAKLILEGKSIYVDFWAREFGVLFLLIPWFKFFDITIINLRFFVFVTKVVLFFLLFFLLKSMNFKNKKDLFILFIFSILISLETGMFAVWHGIFYHFYFLISLLLVFLIYKVFIEKKLKYNLFSVLLFSFLVSFGIITYKPLLCFVFILLVFVEITDKSRRNSNYLFISVVLIMLIFFWIFLSYFLKNSYYHIFRVFFIDIFFYFFILVGVYFFIIIILKLIPYFYSFFQKNYVELNYTEIFVSFLPILIVFFGIYGFFMKNAFFTSITYGLALQYSFILIILEFCNIFLVSKRKRFFVRFFYIVLNIFLIFFSFISVDKYTLVNLDNRLFYLIPIILFTLFILVYKFNNDLKIIDKQKYSFILILFILILFLPNVVGVWFPTKFQQLFFCSILLFPLLNKQVKRIVILSFIFTIIINLSYTNDYFIYDINDFDSSVNYLNNFDSNDSVFSSDPALLSEINLKQIILFQSPSFFRFNSTVESNVGESIYNYTELEDLFPNSDVSLDKNSFFNKIKTTKPVYIIGSHLTFNIFSNKILKNFLYENYDLNNRFGKIYIYKLKTHP